ncbi:MAG: metallophosphoesterase [Pseudomonadota bacterium]
MKLIHLTDLHIAPEGTSDALQGTVRRVRKAIEFINAKHADAELCVVTGDIAYDPDETAYALAEDLLSRLAVPTVSLIGNHDDRGFACAYLSSLSDDGHGFVQQTKSLSRGTAILLDTKDDGTHAGAFCETRQAWLAQKLAECDGPVWLFMHHAPFATGLGDMDTIGMKESDARALAALLGAHGQIAHLFFGHYHRPMSGVWNGIPFSSHRSMMLQCALEFETLSHITAVAEEPQIAIVLADDTRTVVHYHDFDAAHDLTSLGAPDGE